MMIEHSSVPTHLVQGLIAIVGEQYVHTDEASRVIYSRAVGPLEFKRVMMGDYSKEPWVIVQPANTNEVSETIRLANRLLIPVVPYGGGSGITEGTSLQDCILLDMKRFDSISFNKENLTVTAGAGVIGRHLEETLNVEGYTSGHFPQSMNSATIGGYVATAAIGTFSGRYGKMEDLVVGLEVVLPTGDILEVKPIPRRSVGPHLEALFIGSEGAFGIVTQATLKMFPIPETRQWLCCTFDDTPTGLIAIRQLINQDIRPALVRLYDETEASARVRKFFLSENQALLFLAFEGPRGLVNWQSSSSVEILQNYGAKIQSEVVALDWYRHRYDTSAMLRYNQRPGGISDSLEIAAPWENIETLWRTVRLALEPLADEVHVHFSHAYENECSAYVIFYVDSWQGTPQAAINIYQCCLRATMEACLATGGTISHHHGIGRTKSTWMTLEHGDAGMKVLNLLKLALDPNQILNLGSLGIGK